VLNRYLQLEVGERRSQSSSLRRDHDASDASGHSFCPIPPAVKIELGGITVFTGLTTLEFVKFTIVF
jgi:hypothetical protein